MPLGASTIDLPRVVAQAQAGQPEALDTLARHFWDDVHEFLTRQRYLARSDAAAEAADLTQQVFLKLPRVLDGYAEDGHFPAWLRRVAEFEHRTHLRSLIRKRLDTIHTVAGASPDDVPSTLFPTGKARLRALVQELSPAEQEAWNLWVAGLTHVEIAAELGIEKGASYTRVCRARDKLTRWLAASYGPDEAS